MNEQKYNAFISYRRTGHDVAVAKEVQRSLEQFCVPRSIRASTGKEKIDRIFRDQEELEITSDLSGRIEEALEASEYLIVICSPGYKESKWCLHELEAFMRLHGRDHVLCVLSEGEPPDVFPEILLHANEKAISETGEEIAVEVSVEPLACDYRGDFKNARRTELPRLAAVLLGCRYDDLVMRQERYRRRRLAAVFSAASVLAAAAITWLLWSNAQIKENYRQSLISESKLLAKRSLEAFDTQDRLQALDDALQALTGETEDRPVTDEAQYAIAQASYAYSTAYRWLETCRIDDVNDITDYFVSRDLSCVVYMDRTGAFRSFDLSSHRELCSFRVTDSTVPDTPIEGRDGELLCYDGGAVVSADYRNGVINWRLPLKYQAIGGIHLSNDGEYVAAEDSFAVQILTSDGVPYLSMPLPEDVPGYITDLCWSPDDRQIAVKLRIPDEFLYQIGLFDVETSEFKLTEAVYRRIDLVQFDKEGILYLLGDNRENWESESISSVVGKTTTLIPVQYELTAMRNGETLWSKQISEKALSNHVSLQVRETPEKKLVLALGSSIRTYDAAGGELGFADVRKDILALQREESTAINFVTIDGDLGNADPDSGYSLTLKIFPNGLKQIVTVQEENEIALHYVILADGNLCMFENIGDDNVRLFEDDGSQYTPDGFLRSGNQLAVISDRTLRLFDLEEKKQDGSVKLSKEDAWHLLTVRNGAFWLLRISGENGAYSLQSLDVTTGDTIREYSLSGADFFVNNQLMDTPLPREDALYLDYMYSGPAQVAVQGDCIWFHDRENDNVLRCCCLSDGSTKKLDLTKLLGEDRRLMYETRGFPVPSPLVISPDGETLFTACTDLNGGNRTALLIHLEEGQLTMLPGTPGDLSSVAFTDNGVIYAGQRKLWFCSLDGELQEEFSFAGDNPISFAWHSGRLYCVFPDSSLKFYENGEEIRSIPLSFDLNMNIIDGKVFRYEFSDKRLYLYCGGDMNAVMLDSDGETAVYYAKSVLAHLEDRQELLVFCSDREKMETSGDMNYYLGSFPEYTVQDLIERAKSQLAAYSPI